MAGRLESFSKWVQLKIYQLEVTLSVYMFTPNEKFIFCTLLLLPSPSTPNQPTNTTPDRLGLLPPLLPNLHRDGALPPPARAVHTRPGVVLHERRRRDVPAPEAGQVGSAGGHERDGDGGGGEGCEGYGGGG